MFGSPRRTVSLIPVNDRPDYSVSAAFGGVHRCIESVVIEIYRTYSYPIRTSVGFLCIVIGICGIIGIPKIAVSARYFYTGGNTDGSPEMYFQIAFVS